MALAVEGAREAHVGAVVHRARGHLARAAVRVERDGVLVHGLVEQGREGDVAGDRFERLIPTCEGIGDLRGGGLLGRTIEDRHRAVGNGLGLDGLAVHDPGDRVFVHGLRVGRAHRDDVALDRAAPVAERVAVLRVAFLGGQRVAGEFQFSVIGYPGLILSQLGAIFIQPLDRVEARGVGEDRGVGRVALDCRDLGIPAGEGVGGGGGLVLRRLLAVVGRDLAVRHVLVRLKDVVAVLPDDRVGVHGAVEHGGVGHVARDRGDLVVPGLERVGVLRVGRLGRLLAVEGRGRTVGDILVRLEDGAVSILPRDRVGVHGLVVGRGVGRVARDRGDLRLPAREGVGVLRRGGLRRIGRRRRGLAVGDGVGGKKRAVGVQPADRVGVHGRGVLRRVGHVARDRDGIDRPAVERVGVLRVGCLRRGRALIGRDHAVVHRIGSQNAAIVVEPGHSIAAQNLGKLRGVLYVTGNGADCRRPAGEFKIELRGCRLHRGSPVVLRDCAVVHRFIGFNHDAVYDPLNLIAVQNLRISGAHGDDVALGGTIPVVKDVAVLSVTFLGGQRFTRVNQLLIILDVGFLGQQGVVLVQPFHGIEPIGGGEGRGILRVAAYGNDLGRPSGEDVGGSLGACLKRFFSVEAGRRTVRHVLVGFQNRAILVLPGDGVAVHGLGVGGGVGHVAGNRSDILVPSIEGVGVLGVRSLGRSPAVVAGLRTVLHVFVGFQNRAVGVLPSDGVAVHGLGVGGGVDSVLRRGNDLGRPAGEAVAVLGSGSLDGGLTGVVRHLAVGHRTGGQFRTVIVQPANRVSVDFPLCKERGCGIGIEGDIFTGLMGFSGSVGHGVPADEVISIPDEAAIRQSDGAADLAAHSGGLAGGGLCVGIEAQGNVVGPDAVDGRVFVAVEVFHFSAGNSSEGIGTQVFQGKEQIIIRVVGQTDPGLKLVSGDVIPAAGREAAGEDRALFQDDLSGAAGGLYHTAQDRGVFNGQGTVHHKLAASFGQLSGIGDLAAFLIRCEDVGHIQSLAGLDDRAGVLPYCNDRAGQDDRAGADAEAAALLVHLNAVGNRKGEACGVQFNVGIFHFQSAEGHVSVEAEAGLADEGIGNLDGLSSVVGDGERRILCQVEHCTVANSKSRCQILLAAGIDHEIAIQFSVRIQNQIALDVQDHIAVEGAAACGGALDCHRSAVEVRHHKGLIDLAGCRNRAARDIAAVGKDAALGNLDGGVRAHGDLTVDAIGAAGNGMITGERAADYQHCAVGNCELCAVQLQLIADQLSRRGQAGDQSTDLFIGVGMLRVCAVDRLRACDIGQKKGNALGDRHVVGLLDVCQNYDGVAALGGGHRVVQGAEVMVADLGDRLEGELPLGEESGSGVGIKGDLLTCLIGNPIAVCQGVPAGENVILIGKATVGQVEGLADLNLDSGCRAIEGLQIGVKAQADVIGPDAVDGRVFVAVEVFHFSSGNSSEGIGIQVFQGKEQIFICAFGQTDPGLKLVAGDVIPAAGREAAGEEGAVLHNDLTGVSVGLYHTAQSRAAFNGQAAVHHKAAAGFGQLSGIGGRVIAFMLGGEYVCHIEGLAGLDDCAGVFGHMDGGAGQDDRAAVDGEAAALLLHCDVVRNGEGDAFGVDGVAHHLQLQAAEADVAVEAEGGFADGHAGNRLRVVCIIVDGQGRAVLQIEQTAVANGASCRPELRAGGIEHGVSAELCVRAQHQIALDVQDRVAVEGAAAGAGPGNGDAAALEVRHDEGLINRAGGVHGSAGDVAAVGENGSVGHIQRAAVDQADLTVGAVGSAADGLIAGERAAHDQLRAAGRGQLRAIQRQQIADVLTHRRNAGGQGADGLVGVGVRVVGTVDSLSARRIRQQEGNALGNRDIVGLNNAGQNHDGVAALGGIHRVVQGAVVMVADLGNRLEGELPLGVKGGSGAGIEGNLLTGCIGSTVAVCHGVPADEVIIRIGEAAVRQVGGLADLNGDRGGRTLAGLQIGFEIQADVVGPKAIDWHIFIAFLILQFDAGNSPILLSSHVAQVVEPVVVRTVGQAEPGLKLVVGDVIPAACAEASFQNGLRADIQLAGTVGLHNAGKGSAILDGQGAVHKQISALCCFADGIRPLAAFILRREGVENQQRGARIHLRACAFFDGNGRSGEDSCLRVYKEAAAFLDHINVVGNTEYDVFCRNGLAEGQCNGTERYVTVYSKGILPNGRVIELYRLRRIIADCNCCAFIQHEQPGGIIPQDICPLTNCQDRQTSLCANRIDHGQAFQRTDVMNHEIALDVHQSKTVERCCTGPDSADKD